MQTPKKVLPHSTGIMKIKEMKNTSVSEGVVQPHLTYTPHGYVEW